MTAAMTAASAFRTPPSFAAHRRTLTNDQETMESMVLDPTPAEAVAVAKPIASPGVYTIPQRLGGSAPPPSPATPGVRAPPPPSLQLGDKPPAAGERAPGTAPPRGRLAYAAAARGISLDLLSPKSPATARRWPASPLTASSPRQRGLTVGVLNGASLVAESCPVTPGLPTPLSNLCTPTASKTTFAAALATPRSAGLAPPSVATPSGRRALKDIILCRYYHTPGMTCTSSPCRFVHNIDALGLEPGPTSPYALRSPCTPNADQTSGTFALAQATAPLPVLKFDNANIAPGETVSVVDATGAEVRGSAFKMSGGGKGPAGKCRAKFKTVPCKEYADNNCAYGDYCSFIHDPDNLYDEAKHGKVKVKKRESPVDVILTPGIEVDVNLTLPPRMGTLSQPPKRRDLPPIPQGTAATFPPATPPASLTPSPDVSPGESDISDPAGQWDPARLRATFDTAPLTFDNYPPFPDKFTPTVNHLFSPDYYPSTQYYDYPNMPMSAPAYPPSYNYDSVVWTPGGWQMESQQAKPKRAYYRTRPCRFFAQGHCPHGDNCNYLHTQRDKTTTATPTSPKSDTPKPYRTRPCRHFAVGRCHHGEKCNFAHVFPPSPSGPGPALVAEAMAQAQAQSLSPSQAQSQTQSPGKAGWYTRTPEVGEEGAHALTEERLAAACADLRARMRATTEIESDDESDADDVEIVTVATGAGSLSASVKSGAVSV